MRIFRLLIYYHYVFHLALSFVLAFAMKPEKTISIRRKSDYEISTMQIAFINGILLSFFIMIITVKGEKLVIVVYYFFYTNFCHTRRSKPASHGCIFCEHWKSAEQRRVCRKYCLVQTSYLWGSEWKGY